MFYDPRFSVIDATFLHANGRHYLIIKDETRNPPKKYLQIAECDEMRGPFEKLWEDVTSKLVLPDEGKPVRMWHGTIIEVSREIVAPLRRG